MGTAMYQPVEEKKECEHLVVAGGVCLKCRKTIEAAQPKVLTFDDLRATVRANSKRNKGLNTNAMLNFWLQR